MHTAIRTALLYIGTGLSVNTVSFQRDQEEFHLPSFFPSRHEDQLIRRMISTAPNSSVCFVKDRLFAEYCFAFVEDQVIFVGPYRTRRLYKSQLPPKPTMTEAEKDRYIALYRNFPNVKEEDIRLAMHIMFTGLYGTADLVTEATLDMREKILDGEWDEGILPEPDEQERHISQGVYDIQLLSYIRTGNYEGAIRAYRMAMNSRGKTFILVNTIEGLSVVRCVCQIAMQEAGVSPTALAQVVTDFKMRGRIVTSITDSRHLAEKLIQDSCRLVRENLTTDYSPAIQRAVDYIHFHLSDQLTISMIADEVGMTPNSLSTKFHSEIGETPTAYITRKRLENAAQLLRNTQMSVLEICTRIGILDSSYFTRCFKKIYACSPSEYRKKGSCATQEIPNSL